MNRLYLHSIIGMVALVVGCGQATVYDQFGPEPSDAEEALRWRSLIRAAAGEDPEVADSGERQDSLLALSAATLPTQIRVYRRSRGSCSESTIETLPFEDYVKGVLPAEWIASWGDNSLRAGAVAIRSYAAYWQHLYASRGHGKFSGCPAALDDTPRSMAYKSTRNSRASAAVDATRGWAILYSGVIAQAEFSAENGLCPENGSAKCKDYRGIVLSQSPSFHGVKVDDQAGRGKKIFGHGRGMSQWGSQYWSKQGKDWKWIVGHYYPNTELRQVASVDGGSGSSDNSGSGGNASCAGAPREIHSRHPCQAEASCSGAASNAGSLSSGSSVLVTNSNPLIVFKDEEGDGSDRKMRRELQAVLDRLAPMVAEEWPGITLRVTEAWDATLEHGCRGASVPCRNSRSHHYDGRAADITTSDRDVAKYPRLAGLAYAAGFSWVINESNHIHASVRLGGGPPAGCSGGTGGTNTGGTNTGGTNTGGTNTGGTNTKGSNTGGTGSSGTGTSGNEGGGAGSGVCLSGQIGSPCSTGRSGSCATGKQVCRGGDWVCEIIPGCENSNSGGPTLPGGAGGSAPVCTTGQLGASCSTGRLGSCAVGQDVCRGGRWVCESRTGPAHEICDGLDNDCDGQVDEGNPGGGAICNSGRPGMCAQGQWTCSQRQLVCVAQRQPTAEICDGLDNNCDGRVDESSTCGEQQPAPPPQPQPQLPPANQPPPSQPLIPNPTAPGAGGTPQPLQPQPTPQPAPSVPAASPSPHQVVIKGGSCSVGEGGAAGAWWLVGLALVAGRRRRRHPVSRLA